MNVCKLKAGAALFVAHLLSCLISFVFLYIWPYRREIILKNLAGCFPEYPREKLKGSSRTYYRHLADLIVEAWLLSKLSECQVDNLVRYRNVGVLKRLIAEGKDIVLVASHYGNWEYSSRLPEIVKCDVLAAYSPISNRHAERAFMKMRSRFGVQLVPKSDWYRTAIGRRSQAPAILITIADQRPPSAGKQVVSFFDKPTYIQAGAARIAAKRNCAVVYADVQKTGRHRYTFDFQLITETACETGQAEIMELYFKALENTIRREPAYWLWSHNRWKYDAAHCFQARTIA